MRIYLTDFEMRMAAHVGIERSIQSIAMGLKDAHGFDGDGRWDINIEGAAAEQALAKYLGRYWGGDIGTFKKPDIGKNIQVRSTVLRNGSLIIRENDNENDYYVLVTGKMPDFEIVGYILGKDAKQNEYWKQPNERPGAWFVAQDRLKKF